MGQSSTKANYAKFAPALLAAAGLVFAVPTAGFALTGSDAAISFAAENSFARFTPATVDPELASRVAERLSARGKIMRFTPAGPANDSERMVTVAFRVDNETARAISVRSAIAGAEGASSRARLDIAPTRYNLGIARGYQSFAKPAKASSLPAGIRNIGMPDLAEFKPSEAIGKDKPSRFQPRIALEGDKGTLGRARGTLDSPGEQSVDLGGAYRVSGNLNVTAGVRLSQDRDRIAPLTDTVQDSQAVYVGTQLRF